MIYLNRSILSLLLSLIKSKSRLIVYLLIIVVFELVVSAIFSFSSSSKSKQTSGNSKNDAYAFIKSDNLIYLDDDSTVNTSNYLVELRQLNEKTKQLRDYLNNLNRNLKQIDLNKRDLGQINKSEYKILEYTKIFYEQRYCDQEIDSKTIYLKECPYKNCQFTCDRRQIQNVDAVLFHEWDLEQLDIEQRIFLKRTLSHSAYRMNQIWILWNDEANKIRSNLDYYFFNWTMTYRPDAEINDCSYGCSYKKDNMANNELFVANMKVEFKKRTNQALWFVSNCRSSLRLNLASAINQYYPVRVNGNCDLIKQKTSNYDYEEEPKGYFARKWRSIYERYFMSASEKAKKEKWERLKRMEPNECKRNSKCEYDEFRTSKFYLSFESKNCSNYITEKLWRILRTKLIPVVFQPSKQFYELYAPPNSYIHAGDFNYNPKMLADYLDLVSNDFNEYMKYHLWRLDYDVVYSMRQCESRRMCQLCTRLNTETANIYYKKISNWFNEYCVIN